MRRSPTGFRDANIRFSLRRNGKSPHGSGGNGCENSAEGWDAAAGAVGRVETVVGGDDRLGDNAFGTAEAGRDAEHAQPIDDGRVRTARAARRWCSTS